MACCYYDLALSILRHYFEGHLKLLEVSLDVALVHNALDLILEGDDHLLPDVTIRECRRTDVMVLFCTTSTAYRLVLPHPEKIVTVIIQKHLIFHWYNISYNFQGV